MAAFSPVSEFFEPIKTVPAVAHQHIGFGHIAELLRQIQHADLRPDNILLSGDRPHSSREGGLYRAVR
jgi:hypothetical protein